jgi:hypothetical protein
MRVNVIRNRLMCATVPVLLGVALAMMPMSAGATSRPTLRPQLVARVSGSSAVYIVSTSSAFESNNPSACNYQACFNLRRTNNNGANFTTVHLPTISFVNGSMLGNVSSVIFATTEDGYILLQGPTTTLQVTLDGAKTWHREVIATGSSVLDFTTSESELYAVIARCPKFGGCTDYQFARSPLSANKWSFTNLARWFSVTGVGIGAYGSNVWLNQQTAAATVMLTSHNQGRTFARSTVAKLGSVSACSLTAASATALWAQCPTGMMVSFFYSSDGGVKWNALPTNLFSGTGGGAFDPVSSSVAYLAYGLNDLRGSKNFYRVTDEGRTTTAVGKLSCRSIVGMVFTNSMDGLAACYLGTQSNTSLLHTSDGGAMWSTVGFN